MFPPSDAAVSRLYPSTVCDQATKSFTDRSGSETFYQDIAQLVTSSVSPANSPDTVDDDLASSPGPSPIYYYAEPSFGSPSSPTEMYDSDPPSAYPASSSNIYQQPLATPQNAFSFNTVSDIRESGANASYPSDSPSPGDVHSSVDFQQPSHLSSYNPAFLEANPPSPSILDQRRMSEPAILAVPNAYSTNSSSYSMPFNNSSRSSYPHSLQRGASIGSLRDLHLQHQHLHYSSSRSQSAWKTKEDSHHMSHGAHGSERLDSPLSPFQTSFTGSPTMAPGLQYSPIAEDRSVNSPTGTSSSTHRPSAEDVDTDGNPTSMDPNSKTYSFVALPGNAVKKRPRRRYDEIERLYQCSWPDCNKAYGTLNHLNAHVTMQKHGQKRSPNEFKELRKQWRKAKKESEAVALSGTSRRPSHLFGQDHELNDLHSSRYPSSHQRYGFSSGITLPGLSSHSRYLGPDDMGFASAERDERSGLPFGARPRYDTTPTSPWSTSSRSSGTPYLSSSLPSQSSMPHFQPVHGHSHSHSLHQLHFDSPGSNYHSHPSPTESSDRIGSLTIPSPMQTGRLPPDSMLLTPLPGYESRETLPPLQPQVGSDMTYDPEAYYEGNSGRRSSSAHASMGRGSGDDY
ncbi:hypothetical protein GYMLUDRAFT_58766 [Collybiopsis luxurians FD-317 M1]|uniref:C2H2-type domain-containing protein n=1 Tax=Collybiopsis luxurians FD-317 M1 TaxID=944289 RepID=A0A0D0CZ01_9AGAR|nr:hypothetical protein GYMLUDRAFT_58766 [Collybiopsis luxurians FD-317 M1]